MTFERPGTALLAATVVVAASTLLLPYVGGYGTVLFQLLSLNAWGVVASLTSQHFADTHHGLVWTIALVLNLIAFLIVALPVWVTYRNRRPAVGSLVIIAWSVFYLACLFLLFPAGSGP